MTSQLDKSHDLLAEVSSTADRHSVFEEAVRKLPISVPTVFLDATGNIRPATFRATDMAITSGNNEAVARAFPKTIALHNNVVLEAVPFSDAGHVTGKRVAVLFSGGPAAGGHNVLAGIRAVLGTGNTLIGIRKGPKGLIEGNLFEIPTPELLKVINTGGFDYLGTDRTKIKTPQQFERVKKTVLDNKLDGVIVVGGDDSNTNAAFIAEYLQSEGIPCSVIGIPKTIDGDMAVGKYLPISFGFDTATKLYAELVGNLTQDAASSVKYWHFVKLMGRTASKITLEVALQTKPAVALMSEEIAERNLSLDDIVNRIVKVITERRLKGINHGVVLIPEGLVEFIPEMGKLISELNAVIAEYERDIKDLPTLKNKQEFLYPRLSPQSAQLMASLPEEIQEMFILDRDDHGNVKVSQIETEKLLIEKIRYKISEIKRHPTKFFGSEEGLIQATPEQIEQFKTMTFSPLSHFLGYEGRSAKPTTFDAAFTFALGLTAGSLVLEGKTGYMAAITAFDKGGRPLALPLAALITSEARKGKEELVIEKSLVRTDSPAFKVFEQNRDRWAREDVFSSPGPIQHWGPTSKQIPISVALNQDYDDYLKFDLGTEKEVRFEED